MKNNNSNIDSLLELVKKVNLDIKSTNTVPINLVQSYKLFEEIEYLHEKIYQSKKFTLDTNNRLESILQILSEMANMDFSSIAEVKENFDHLDYFAFSLNHTSNRISKEVEFLQCFKKIFDSFKDLYVITDEKGTIRYCNKNLKNIFKIKSSKKTMHIKDLFESSYIKNNFSIDFVNTCGNHGIVAGFEDCENTDTLLRVSSKAYFNENGVKQGYCYKVEEMNQAVYRKGKSIKNQIIESIYKENIPNSIEEKKELLLSISREYSGKTELNYREILILNSVNKQLESLK